MKREDKEGIERKDSRIKEKKKKELQIKEYKGKSAEGRGKIYERE
jgi:hypothetical protein